MQQYRGTLTVTWQQQQNTVPKLKSSKQNFKKLKRDQMQDMVMAAVPSQRNEA